MDNWLGAGSKKGDKAVVLMQFPKTGANKLADSRSEERRVGKEC